MFNTTSRMRISVQTGRLTAGLAKADQKLEYKSENLSTALPVSVVRPLLVPEAPLLFFLVSSEPLGVLLSWQLVAPAS